MYIYVIIIISNNNSVQIILNKTIQKEQGNSTDTQSHYPESAALASIIEINCAQE